MILWVVPWRFDLAMLVAVWDTTSLLRFLWDLELLGAIVLWRARFVFLFSYVGKGLLPFVDRSSLEQADTSLQSSWCQPKLFHAVEDKSMEHCKSLGLTALRAQSSTSRRPVVDQWTGSLAAYQHGPWSCPGDIVGWRAFSLFCIWCLCLGRSPGRHLSASLRTSCWTVSAASHSLVSLHWWLRTEWMNHYSQGPGLACHHVIDGPFWWNVLDTQTWSWSSIDPPSWQCKTPLWDPWMLCTSQRCVLGTSPCNWHTYSEHHINCHTLLSKVTLALWQQVVSKVLSEEAEKNPGKDLPYYAE